MKQKSKIRLVRRIHFSSGHRYFNPKFSKEKNKEIFGSCYSTYGHGHNYILEAHFEGPMDSNTGMIISLANVDKILKNTIDPLDHHHLNFDVDYFKQNIPTTENIACYLFQKIQIQIKKPHSLYKVRLFEGKDLWVDYRA